VKKKFLYLCFLALLSTACQKRSSELDVIILQCYDPTYQEAGYDIKSIIDDYEGLLIQQGVLEDGSGESYLEVWEKINSDKGFRIEVPAFRQYDPWHKVDKQNGVAVKECAYEMIASLQEKDSRWQQVFGPSEAAESTENPAQMYEAMVENMSEEDMNSYYFRLKMFELFDMVNLSRE
jgi:hypothetical protein